MKTPMQTIGEAKPPASAQERLEFLRQSIAMTEHNIRSYDTKAQISLAAFLLSMTPLWTITMSICAEFPKRPEAVILVLLFLTNILLYCYVLWPKRLIQKGLTSVLSTQNLFYLRDPAALGSAQYVKMLAQVSIEDELTGESLKLSQLRVNKNRRYNVALGVSCLFYVVFALIFLRLRATC